MKMFKFAFALVFFSAVVLLACNKDNRTSTLHVRLTDAPTELDEVNVDLKSVEVNFSNDTAGWITLATRDTIYNLLGLQNGLDTLIAEAVVPAGTLHEIRLVLGDENTVKVNGEVFPLTIPSGSTSGLKIKVNKKLNADFETVTLDFDAGASVNQEQDGYKLRPVIRVK